MTETKRGRKATVTGGLIDAAPNILMEREAANIMFETPSSALAEMAKKNGHDIQPQTWRVHAQNFNNGKMSRDKIVQLLLTVGFECIVEAQYRTPKQ